LRKDWRVPATALAIDHTQPGAMTTLHLRVDDREWIGPNWSFEADSLGPPTASRVRTRIVGSAADLFEWSFRLGPVRLTRSAVFLKSHDLLLLADEVEGAVGLASSTTVDLGRLVRVEPVDGLRGLELWHSGRSRVRVWPLALPSLAYASDRGRLESQGSLIRLVQNDSAPRIWMPLLFSWNAARIRKPLHWRVLTVSESFQKCRPGTAFAVRVAFKGEPSLVIYRSLARPARRAFLGHQTTGRFLIGEFHSNGTIKPLLEVE
jgi:hypothetical protein